MRMVSVTQYLVAVYVCRTNDMEIDIYTIFCSLDLVASYHVQTIINLVLPS